MNATAEGDTTKQLRTHIHWNIYRRHHGERRDYRVLDTKPHKHDSLLVYLPGAVSLYKSSQHAQLQRTCGLEQGFTAQSQQNTVSLPEVA